jgi:peptidoglycan hydrolase CwlO-like protein
MNMKNLSIYYLDGIIISDKTYYPDIPESMNVLTSGFLTDKIYQIKETGDDEKEIIDDIKEITQNIKDMVSTIKDLKERLDKDEKKIEE